MAQRSAIAILLMSFFCMHAPHAQIFTEASQSAGINHFVYSPALLGGGAAFFDYNNDGWLDIYITGGMTRDQLYHNNGNGTFTERGAAAGLYADGLYYTMGVTTGDIDNDGDRDVLVTTWGDQNNWAIPVRNILYRNNGNGTFTDIAPAAGITDSAWSVSASMGDYNLDGYLDIYIGNYVEENGFIRDSITNEIIGFSHVGFPNNFYLNNGNGTFTDIAQQMGMDNEGITLGSAFTDYDNDSDPDLYVANDFGAWMLPNALYRNNYPVNSFTDVSAVSAANAAIYAMGIAIGDYDEDGDLDYYITNIGRNVLYQNNNNGTFTDRTDAAGVANAYTDDSLLTTGWGTAFFDYDNDTWLDLFISNGQIPAADIIATGEKDPNKLYKNNRNGTFTDVSALENLSDSTKGRGFITGDYDNDGDLDLVVVCSHQFISGGSERVLLYRNDQANGNHWLKVQLQGTTNNRDAFGARVEVYAGGRKWIREIDGGSSHASQNSSIAHFGLGNYTTVDSLVVIWPGGVRQAVASVAVDTLVTIVEGQRPKVQEDVYIEICEGDSVQAGGAWQTTSGVYYDTLLAGGGTIDSIVITYLTVLPDKYNIFTYVVCEDDSIYVNGIYFHSDTLLIDSLTAYSGCDSFVVVEITLRPWQIAIADAFLCEGDSIFAGGAWQTQGGSYYDTIAGDGICNYIVITAVDVIPAIEPDTQTISICTGDSIFLAGAFRSTAGWYVDTFAAAFGCDSLLFTDLRVTDHSTQAISIALCAGDSAYAGGNWQKETGTYYDTFSNANGCDSVLISALVFENTVSTQQTLTIEAGDSVFTGGGWQTESGTYRDTFPAVNGCDSVAITDLVVLPVGIADALADLFQLSIYPNPAHANFTVAFFLPHEQVVTLRLFDVSGKEVLKVADAGMPAGTHRKQLSISGLAAGMYVLSFQTEHHGEKLKLLIY